MARFYQPDLTENIDSPFVRDASNKLVRRSYWLDMNDRTVVLVMTQGIGANLTNDEKRAHLHPGCMRQTNAVQRSRQLAGTGRPLYQK